METPYGRTYWIQQGSFLAGAYPDSIDEQGRYQKLKALLDFGITRFVNLMEYGENPVENRDFHEYEPFLPVIARKPVSVIRFPIPVGGVPDVDETVRLLDYIDSSIETRNPLFLHSFSGRGRVGMMVGCWLIRHGLADSDNVLDVIRDLRKNEATAPLRSPQTDVQQVFVRSWKRNL